MLELTDTLHNILPSPLEVTAERGMSNAELERVLPGYDAVIVRSANKVTRSMLVASPRLAAVGRAGSGVDNIDLVAAAELGVPVVNAPTGNARSVAGEMSSSRFVSRALVHSSVRVRLIMCEISWPWECCSGEMFRQGDKCA